jgi:DNA-3-methyladenine glycosylase
MPLTRHFYQRHPTEVAPDLLGKILVRQMGETCLQGRIVEVEAYSSDDPASHTFRGMTTRNRAMFGEAGHAYIYFIHGMHYCINVTARSDTPAGGVLIRALEPLAGIAVMQKLRSREKLAELASGPAKLTQAMAIDKALYGTDMTKRGPLFIDASMEPDVADRVIKATPRIGISKAVDVPWRFILAGSNFCSR